MVGDLRGRGEGCRASVEARQYGTLPSWCARQPASHVSRGQGAWGPGGGLSLLLRAAALCPPPPPPREAAGGPPSPGPPYPVSGLVGLARSSSPVSLGEVFATTPKLGK